MMVQESTSPSDGSDGCHGQQRRNRRSRSARRRIRMGGPLHRVQPSLESIPEDFCKEHFTSDHGCSWNDDDPCALVNQERTRRNLPPFLFSPELQQLAEQHCRRMAHEGSVFHSVQSIDQLVALLRAPHVAESIQRGDSLLDMHYETLSQRRSVNYCNLVSTVFTEFGAATCRGPDGKLYQCHMFRK